MDTIPLASVPLTGSLKPGRHLYRLQALLLRDGTHLEIPSALLVGKQEHPLVIIAAGLHGDEWNGVQIADRLAREIRPSQVRGTLAILPVCNPFAFYERARVSSIDSADLNRSFGLDEPRKPTEMLAALLFEHLFSHADAIVELHTGGPGEYVPLVMAPSAAQVDLAASLGLPYVLTGTPKHHSLAREATDRSIALATVIVGQARVLDPDACDTVYAGLLNFLRYLHALRGRPSPTTECTVFEQKAIISAPCAGFFDCQVPLGAQVREGESIGSVAPLLEGKAETAETPVEGTIVYLRREQVVDERETLAHVAF